MRFLETARSRRLFAVIFALLLALTCAAGVQLLRDAKWIDELEDKAARLDLHCGSVRSALIDASAAFRSKEPHMRRQAGHMFYRSLIASYRSRDIFLCARKTLDEHTYNARYEACLGPELSVDELMGGVERQLDHGCLARLADELRDQLAY